MPPRRKGTELLVAFALSLAPVGAQELAESCEEPPAKGRAVGMVEDGASGRAWRFDGRDSRADLGALPFDSSRPFTLGIRLRTRNGAFATALMARSGDAVGASLVMGREPGRISFEAWSWQAVRLVSRTRVDDGAWHRIEVAYNATSQIAVLAVDGRDEAMGVLGDGASPEALLRLGDNIGAHQPFDGDLDELRIRPGVDHADRFARLIPAVTTEELRRALRNLRERALPRRSEALDHPTPQSWGERRARLVPALADVLGLAPMPPRGPVDARVEGRWEGDGFFVERLSWEAWPGRRARGWLWRPADESPRRRPAVLSPHGHWGGSHQPVIQERCIRFARAGAIVLVIDSVHVEDIAAGVSSIGAMTFDNIRGLDLLCERDDVDPRRILVTGASGGAQQSLYMMALESRLAGAAPVCMISYFGEILDETSAHCGCNHANRLAWTADEPEIGAVFAPRPTFVGSVTGDWTRRFPLEGGPEWQRLWTAHERGGDLVFHHREAGHNYDAVFQKDVLEFAFARVFHEEPRPAPAAEPQPLDLHRLIPGSGQGGPPDAAVLAAEHLARRKAFGSLAEAAPGLDFGDRRAERVAVGGPAVADGWSRTKLMGADGVPLPLVLRDRKAVDDEPWLLVADSRGMSSVLLEEPDWLERAPRLALVDPRYFGAFAPFAAAWRRNAMMLGRGELYQAALDLATAARNLPGKGAVTLRALGDLAPAALLAARIEDRIREVRVDDLGPSYAESGGRLPQAPEIRRWGDVDRLRREAEEKGCVIRVGDGAGSQR